MELAHLKTFLAIYHHQNLSRASEELHLSQPAVSNHLKTLEADLGRPLFVRKARGVTATPLADSLANDITDPIQSLTSIVATYAAGADRLDKTIYLGGPSDALSSKVIPALIPLTTAGLRIRAITGGTTELLDRLSAGELDLVIATTPARKRGISLHPLFTETLSLVAGQRWAQRLQDPTIEALAKAPMIAYAENLQLIRRYYREVFSATPPTQPRIVLDDLRGIIAAVSQGAGWTVIPTYLATAELVNGSLQTLMKPPNAPTNTLYLARRIGQEEPGLDAVTQALLQDTTRW